MSLPPTRRAVLSTLGAGGLGALAGCLSDIGRLSSDSEAEAVGGTDRTIQLGIMQPLSGDLGAVGNPIADAAELPVTQVRDAVDIGIEYTTVDTGADPIMAIGEAVSL
ncbi:ABC transporter substrate-binding protein, partial [Halobacteria archaeon AArc-curdl1]|nr:ABC transporter substrate-binding protein [Halobacteria archaeon AArc-curdl1]